MSDYLASPSLLQRLLKFYAREGLTETVSTAVYVYFQKRHKRRQRQVAQYKQNFDSKESKVYGLPISLMDEPSGLSETLYLYGIHEPISSRVYSNFLQPNEQVIDVGANIGYFPLIARSKAGAGGKVLCIEPLPENCVLLRNNLDRYPNVTVCQGALGDQNGETTFYVADSPNWGSTIKHHNVSGQASISVDVFGLDEMLAKGEWFVPTMIRMDIEGGEIDALTGAWQTISTHKPRLFVEFHPQYVSWDAIVGHLNNLEELGYNRIELISRRWDESWLPSWTQRRIVKQLSMRQLVQKIEKGDIKKAFTIATYPD